MEFQTEFQLESFLHTNERFIVDCLQEGKKIQLMDEFFEHLDLKYGTGMEPFLKANHLMEVYLAWQPRSKEERQGRLHPENRTHKIGKFGRFDAHRGAEATRREAGEAGREEYRKVEQTRRREPADDEPGGQRREERSDREHGSRKEGRAERFDGQRRELRDRPPTGHSNPPIAPSYLPPGYQSYQGAHPTGLPYPPYYLPAEYAQPYFYPDSGFTYHYPPPIPQLPQVYYPQPNWPGYVPTVDSQSAQRPSQETHPKSPYNNGDAYLNRPAAPYPHPYPPYQHPLPIPTLPNPANPVQAHPERSSPSPVPPPSHYPNRLPPLVTPEASLAAHHTQPIPQPPQNQQPIAPALPKPSDSKSELSFTSNFKNHSTISDSRPATEKSQKKSKIDDLFSKLVSDK